MTTRIVHNSGTYEWYTPAPLIEAARRVLGTIDLDPASCEAANAVVQADHYYTQEDNGLAHPWEGRVWLNPPYTAPLCGLLCAKLAASHRASTVSAAVVLVNNASETRWFCTLADQASAVCFPTGRVRFWHPDRPSTTPLQGQALLYLGPHAARFVDVFADHGTVWLAVPR